MLSTTPSCSTVTRFGHPVCSSAQTLHHTYIYTIDPQHQCPPPIPVRPVSKSGGEGCCGVGGVRNIAFCIIQGRPESDRTKLKHLQSWDMPYCHLKAHMSVKVNDSPQYQAFLDEIETHVIQKDNFTENVFAFLCDCDTVDQVSVGFIVCATFIFSTTSCPLLSAKQTHRCCSKRYLLLFQYAILLVFNIKTCSHAHSPSSKGIPSHSWNQRHCPSSEI